MSSLFSHEEVGCISHGPFQSSLLIILVQPQHSGMPDKIHICWHLLKALQSHTSVNSHIKKEDFPIHFDTASKVADLVSLPYLWIPPHNLVSLHFICEPLSTSLPLQLRYFHVHITQACPPSTKRCQILLPLTHLQAHTYPGLMSICTPSVPSLAHWVHVLLFFLHLQIIHMLMHA